MPQAVVHGALTMCSFGQMPGSLNVLPANRTMAGNLPQANIMDNKPFVNVMPFGLCMSLANPITAAQTAAAMGVLTPGACTPMTSAPWAPGAAQTQVASFPALTNNCKCVCSYGGVIQITYSGVATVMVT